MKKTAGLLCILLLAILASPEGKAEGRLAGVRSWLCFYAARFPARKFPPYDLYVFQPEGHPDLAPIKVQGGRAIGYVSVGEASRDAVFFQRLREAGIIVDENKEWAGAFRVDLRSQAWHDIVLKELIPGILTQGFDGVFIDTIDVASYLEQEKGLAGSVERAVALIREIRARFPEITIVLNNGLFLLTRVGDVVDAAAVEDVFTLYDFKRKRPRLATSQWTDERLVPLKEFQGLFHKPVLSLDYWISRDRRGMERIARKAREQGFVPAIGDIHLATVFFHP